MTKRILAILLAWSCGLTALHAANVVTVKGAEGDVRKQVEISVDLTTDADVVAAEIRIPMPSGVTPIDGSCLKVDSRLPSHSVAGNMNGNEYVIVIFNSNLTPIPAGSGKALSFKLNLTENPGIFDLTPRVKLSDASGKSLQASVSGETLKILGAKLELSETDIDFGRVPIRGSYTKTVTATNIGTSTLNFSEFTTDVPGLTVTSDSESVEPNGSATLTLAYKPLETAASIAGRFTALSNSVGRAPFVRVTSVPFSVNELHVGSADGISDSEVTIAVKMNNMEPIVGAEVSFKLPEELEYVDGSVSPSSRASGFSASANFGADRNLRLVLFNLGNQAVTGDDGELMTFKLKLTGRSGSYSLNPQNVILSNSTSENMVSATSAGSVTISSPSMQSSNVFDIGNVPLSGDNTFDYHVYNGSSVPLTIEKVVFLDNIAECKASFPITVDAYSNGTIPVTISNPKFGEFESTMNVYSNDPDNRLKVVSIKGNFYSANELTVKQTIDNGQCTLTAGLTNEAEIVALQLDIIMPAGAPTLTESNLKLLDRAQTHSATLAKVGENTYRIIIFSLNNASFSGNSGNIFSLSFDAEGIEGKPIRIENVKLSSKDGVNFTTPNTEVIIDNVPIAARSIDLSATSVELKVGETATLIATVVPDNTTDKSVSWKSSDESVATVDANGKVTAKAIGEATISSTCGSVSATCKVTVIPTPVESITLSNTSLSLTEGESATLTVTITPADATDKTVTWTSSDASIATVSATGEVTAVKAGTAIITATSSNGKTATCTVTVAAKIIEATGITLSNTTAELKVGETATLIATVVPDNTTNKTVSWTSSDDAIVTVDANGTVTAIALGDATITAACGSASATCTVTVIPAVELGDVNGDGKITGADVVSLVNGIIGNKPSFFIDNVADVNQDGKLTGADVVTLVNIIIKRQ